MVNYQLGKIYKIYSHIDSNICYVGSTCSKFLCQRMTQHRKTYERWKLGKVPKTTSYDLFEIYGVENCIIELIEEYPCESKDQLSKKEGEYIKSLNCINKYIAGQSKKDSNKIYYNENKEKIAAQKKEYTKQNKETIKNYKINYYNQEENKIKKSITDKIYREKNKEKIAAQKKEWYEKQKILINSLEINI